jgi:hypothetical protein
MVWWQVAVCCEITKIVTWWEFHQSALLRYGTLSKSFTASYNLLVKMKCFCVIWSWLWFWNCNTYNKSVSCCTISRLWEVSFWQTGWWWLKHTGILPHVGWQIATCASVESIASIFRDSNSWKQFYWNLGDSVLLESWRLFSSVTSISRHGVATLKTSIISLQAYL